MSPTATCNAREDGHRCGRFGATWLVVELSKPDGFLRRYETALCPPHAAALVTSGATVAPVHTGLLTA